VDGAALLVALRAELGPDVALVEGPERLTGGFYTANFVFRVTGGPPGWDERLVLRLFPLHSPTGLAEREALVQDLAAAGGVAAPPVLLYRKGARIEGREWFVMKFLSGRPLIGGVGFGEILRLAPALVVRLPKLTADTQLALHRVDATPLIDAMGERLAGVGRWLDTLEQRVASGAVGLVAGWRWLVANQPPPPRHPVLCHGDLWGGNLLVDGWRVTGIIDWTLATAAEPALEIGFTVTSLSLAPVPGPPAVREGVRVVSRWLGRRYLRHYRRASDADLAAMPYYEALRCVIELSGVTAYRDAQLRGAPYDGPQPAWDIAADDLIERFRARTGVTLTVPVSTTNR